MKRIALAFALLLSSFAANAQVGSSSLMVPCASNPAYSSVCNNPTMVPNDLGIPSWVPNPTNPPDEAINWTQNIAWKKNGGTVSIASLGITTTRSTAETNLLPTSPSGFAYTSFPANTTVITSLGRQTYEARTNFLLNSAAPATQTTGSLANGTYTLWVNGSGSATMSSGTATGCGTGAAANGSPISFTLTGTAGTCTVTVSGSLNAFQLELNPGSVSAPTPFIVTVGSTVTRSADVTSMPITVGSACTLFEQATPQTPTSYPNFQSVLMLNDGTQNNRVEMFRISSSGNAEAVVTSGGAAQYSQNGIGQAQNTQFNLAVASAAGTQNFAVNGTLLTPGTGATQPVGITTLDFGNHVGTLQFNGLAAVDAVWLTQAVPSAQLQVMQ